MFQLSRRTRSSLLLILAMGLVPVTIDGCSGSSGGKAKDNFEIITLIGVLGAIVFIGRRTATPALAQAV